MSVIGKKEPLTPAQLRRILDDEKLRSAENATRSYMPRRKKRIEGLRMEHDGLVIDDDLPTFEELQRMGTDPDE